MSRLCNSGRCEGLAASRVNLLLATSASGWPHVAVRLRAHPRRSLYIRTNSRTHPRASADIRVGPRASADIRIHPRTSAGIRRHPRPSADVRRHPRASMHLRRHPQPCRLIRAHPHPSAHIRMPRYDLRSMRLPVCASTTLVACSVVHNSCACLFAIVSRVQTWLLMTHRGRGPRVWPSRTSIQQADALYIAVSVSGLLGSAGA